MRIALTHDWEKRQKQKIAKRQHVFSREYEPRPASPPSMAPRVIVTPAVVPGNFPNCLTISLKGKASLPHEGNLKERIEHYPLHRVVEASHEVYDARTQNGVQPKRIQTMLGWAGESEGTVRGRIEQGLADFFAFENVDFSQDVHFSEVVALLDGIRGVSHVHLHPGG